MVGAAEPVVTPHLLPANDARRPNLFHHRNIEIEKTIDIKYDALRIAFRPSRARGWTKVNSDFVGNSTTYAH